MRERPEAVKVYLYKRGGFVIFYLSNDLTSECQALGGSRVLPEDAASRI